MTIKLEIVAQDQAELVTKLLSLAQALRMGANVQEGVAQAAVKSETKAEEAAPEKTTAKKEKAAAKEKPAPKKASGPSEDTLREYTGTLAAYLLNDAEEAPKLEDLLQKFESEDLEGVAADQLGEFAKELHELVDGIFDGVPSVPTK
ncbi:MAG: hypothetical protein G3W58_22825 [Pantoea ananatis]|nr:hypothetical protein [Pantoea ananatis]